VSAAAASASVRRARASKPSTAGVVRDSANCVVFGIVVLGIVVLGIVVLGIVVFGIVVPRHRTTVRTIRRPSDKTRAPAGGRCWDGSVQIRRATAADAEAIAAVHTRSWQAAYRGLLPQNFLEAMDPDRPTAYWRRALAQRRNPREVVLVATEDRDAVLGFVALGPDRDGDPDGDVGEITSMYLDPEHWSTGFGRALMTAALAQLRQGAFTRAVLWVLKGNNRAIRFYERAGWTAAGATKEDELGGVPVVELRYRRDLTEHEPADTVVTDIKVTDSE
jgi:ribosomal protein S18 acetylase RimI-like enzyme